MSNAFIYRTLVKANDRMVVGRPVTACCLSLLILANASSMYWSSSFSIGAWFTGSVLLVFAVLGRAIVRREHGGEAAQEAIAAGALRRR